MSPHVASWQGIKRRSDGVWSGSGTLVDSRTSKSGGRLGSPAGHEEALLYRYYMHYAEGALMPPLLLKLVLGRAPLFGTAAQNRVQPMIDIHLDFVEADLARRSWSAGRDFTAAGDMSFPLEAARQRAGLDASRPATIAWLEKIHGRPAYRDAL